jgi:hypothetical protein
MKRFKAIRDDTERYEAIQRDGRRYAVIQAKEATRDYTI